MNHDKTTRKALLLAASLWAVAPAWADPAWSETYYNAFDGTLQLFGISLRQGAAHPQGLVGGWLKYKGGRNFELELSSWQYVEMHSRVTAVRVVSTTPPVFLVTAELESDCYKLDPALYAYASSGNEIKIQVKAYFFSSAGGQLIGDCGRKLTAALPFEMNRLQYGLQPGTYTVVAEGKEGSASTTFYYPGVVVPAQ